MRFLLCAISVSILALNLAGCSCSISTTCDNVTSGMVGGGCGPTCTTCETGCDQGAATDCGCDSCGPKLQRPMLMQRLKSRVTSIGCNDCGGAADACGSGVGSRLRNIGSFMSFGDGGCDTGCGGSTGLGMGLLDKGSACNTGTCDTGCDSGCDSGKGIMQAGFNLGSRLKGRMAGCDDGCDDGCGEGGLSCRNFGGKLIDGSLLSRVKGCGKLGCGLGGGLCNSCRGSEPIPHREPGAMGPGAGQIPSYAYPYYTTRAPRDFLMKNPPSIGY